MDEDFRFRLVCKVDDCFGADTVGVKLTSGGVLLKVRLLAKQKGDFKMKMFRKWLFSSHSFSFWEIGKEYFASISPIRDSNQGTKCFIFQSIVGYSLISVIPQQPVPIIS